MKKVLAVIIAVCMVLCFAACDKKVMNENGIKTVKKGILTVSLSPDFAPMEFVDTSKTGQDQYVGFDPTLAKFIADELGFELVISPMDFDACQAAVQSGAVDISISGYSVTDDRKANYELSDYYYAGDNETEQIIITKAENAGKWTKASDYSGKTVAAQVSSLQMNLCNEQLPKDCKIETIKDIGTGVELLRNNKIDAVAVAKGNGDAIIANNSEVAYSGFEFVVGEEAENNVVMIKKGDKAMLDAVNAALKKAYDNGYYAKWYADAKELAGIDTASEISYDEKGQVIK